MRRGWHSPQAVGAYFQSAGRDAIPSLRMDDLDRTGRVGPSKHSQLAVAALLAGAVAIAFAPIFVRLSSVGPAATALWRMALALPLLATWSHWQQRRGPHPPAKRPARYWLIVPGLFFAGDLAVWHWSIRLSTAANATLLANFAPVPVALVGWLWLKERLGGTFLAGMLVALAGAAVVMWSSLSFSRDHFAGDALGLLTALFYAGYQLSVKRLRATYPTATIMAWAAASACPVLLVIALASGEPIWATTLSAWAVLIALAALSHIGGQGLIAWAVAKVPVSFSSVSLLVQPVAVAALAWVILSEPVRPVQAVGGVLVLAGVFLARMGTTAQRQSP